MGAWLAVLVATGCSDVFGPAPDGTCATLPDSAVVGFADPALERAVRVALVVSPQLPLTCGLVERLTSLTVAGAGIASLEGIENLTNLALLSVRANAVTDISPLAGLTRLTSLNLAANRISDVRPLAGLEALEFLAINDNGAIDDIGPLAGLTNLQGTLWVSGNAITSLSALRSLTRLTAVRAWRNRLTDLDGLETLVGLATINAWGNRITDVSALAALPALEFIDLDFNPELSDIGALLDNPNIGPGTDVSLVSTGVSCADIDALRAKGAAVVSSCP